MTRKKWFQSFEGLTTDEIVFKLTMHGDEWVETTLAERSEESELNSGQTIRFVSW